MRRVRFCMDEQLISAERGARAVPPRPRSAPARRSDGATARRTARSRSERPKPRGVGDPWPSARVHQTYAHSALVLLVLHHTNYENLHHVQNNLRDKEKAGNFLKLFKYSVDSLESVKLVTG